MVELSIPLIERCLFFELVAAEQRRLVTRHFFAALFTVSLVKMYVHRTMLRFSLWQRDKK